MLFVCVHAGRASTERDDVVIHMLSSGGGGGGGGYVCVCELMHFLFSDTNMTGTATEN